MGKLSRDKIHGDVKERSVIILDDLIASETTVIRAGKACLDVDATATIAAAAHAVRSAKAFEALNDPAKQQIVLTNSIPLDPERLKLIKNKLTLLDLSPIVAEAIRRINAGYSLSQYFGNE